MSDHERDELLLGIGDVTVAVRCGDDVFMSRVRRAGKKFLSRDCPDFAVTIDLDDEETPEAVVGALFNLHRVEVQEVLQREDVSSRVRISNEEIAIRTGREIFDFDSPNRPRLLNVLLCAAYNTVWERQRDAPRPGYLVHGCGVELGGRSFLFTGHSGAGKTTLAGLAGERPVLNDETVLVSSRGGTFHLTGTPLFGGVENRAVGGAPLEAIYFLEHGSRNAVVSLAPGDAFENLLCQLMQTAPPAPSLDEHRDSVRARADVAAALTGRIPIRRLSFVPDARVWELLETLV